MTNQNFVKLMTPTAKPVNKTIITTHDELCIFLSSFNKQTFAFDTEGTSLKQDEVVVEGMSLYDGQNACYILWSPNLIPTIKELFHNAKTIVAHNIVFDLRVIHKYGIFPKQARLYDTMVAQHLINENEPVGLKHLAQTILGKTEVLSWEEAKSKDKNTFYDYAMNDAIWTWELCMYQQKLMKELNLVKLFREVEMPFQWVLLEMHLTGVGSDLQKCLLMQKKVKQDMEDYQIKILTLLGIKYDLQLNLFGEATINCELNLNSPQQLADLVFNKLGLKVVEKTPSGQPSVGKVTLDAYKDHPVISVLSKYKQCQKILTSFLLPYPTFIQNDGRIRPDFRDTGTTTGRLSCNNPNLQQLPKPDVDPYGVRSLFTVSSDKIMISCDYSGQEVRVMAEQSKDPVLIDALRKGQDMHLKVANQFYNLGIPDECLYETHPEYDKYKKKFKSERTQAKIITFGLAYGKGAFGFSKDFNITEDEAQKMIDKYFEGMPHMHKAIEAAHLEVKKNGFVTSMAGRKRRFDKVIDQATGNSWYPKSALRQSFNFQIQGFSADMIRMAMNKVHETKKEEWGLKAIMTVHDEAVYEVKKEYADEAERFIKLCFETAVTFSVPVVAETSRGNNYLEAK